MSKPDRVFIVSDYYPPYIRGGAELSARHLAASLARQGREVTVLTTNQREGRFRRTVIDNAQVILIPFLFHLVTDKWSRILIRNWAFYLYFLCCLIWIARSRRPEVIHVQNKHLLIPGYVAGRILGIPTFFTARDTLLICPSGICLTSGHLPHRFRLQEVLECNRDLKKIYTGWNRLGLLSTLLATMIFLDTVFLRWAFRHCTGVIFVSRALRRLFDGQNLMNRNSSVIRTIPPNLQACEEVRIPEEVEEIRQGGGRVVFTAGKLSFGKGTQHIIDAAVQVVASHPSVVFVFAGRTDVSLSVPDSIRPNVKFLGQIDPAAVASLYSAAEVVCQASVWPEPFSRTLLESMAYGVPAVASSVGGNPELVSHMQTGILVRPGDSSALAQGIILLLEDENFRKKLGAGALKRLTEQFDGAGTCGEHLRFYASMIR